MNMQVLDARRDVSGGYKVDVSRGQRIGRVSSEWFSRPVLVEIKSMDAKTEAGITIKAQNFMLDVQYTNPEEVTLQDVVPAPAIERQIRQKMLESELPPKPPSAPTRLEAEIPKAAATPASDASSPSSELAKPQRKADKAAKAKEAS